MHSRHTAPVAADVRGDPADPAPKFQLKWMWHELKLIRGRKSIRWILMWFEPSPALIVSYRLNRFFYLLVGPSWYFWRVLLTPLSLFLRVLGTRHELSYVAEIGPGLQLIHPTLGVAVHGKARIGRNCRLAGGNSIGAKRKIERGELVLGDGVFLGINACIIGPAKLGDGVTVGAGAVVVGDLPEGAVAVGVPARCRERGGYGGESEPD